MNRGKRYLYRWRYSNHWHHRCRKRCRCRVSWKADVYTTIEATKPMSWAIGIPDSRTPTGTNATDTRSSWQWSSIWTSLIDYCCITQTVSKLKVLRISLSFGLC